MINIEELRAENQNIADVITVLTELLHKPELRSNPVFCELLERFVEQVDRHLSHEERSVYTELLTHGNKVEKDVANKFMSNSNQLRKIFNGYAKHWCHAGEDKWDHAAFVEQTNDIFRLIRERIQLETDKLFPVLRHD